MSKKNKQPIPSFFPYTEKFILQLLQDIEAGRIKLNQPSEINWCGNTVYWTDNGWEIVIFIDAGEWDYIDTIRHGGKSIDFGGIQKFYPKVAVYEPSEEAIAEIYGV